MGENTPRRYGSMDRVVVSHSFGKDSTLALHKIIAQGYGVDALLVSVNGDDQRSWFHGLSSSVMEKTSHSLGIPLYPVASRGENYREQFLLALTEWQQRGTSACVYGDIDIEEHRTWCQSVSRDAGLQAIHPLWGQSRGSLVESFMNLGYKAVIKTISKSHGVPKDFLGATLDIQLVKEFIKLSIDPCGEGGEFHTFVYDGPIFTSPIIWEDQGVYESEYGYTLII